MQLTDSTLQSHVTSLQFQATEQSGGPDEIIVNEQEQNKEVNEQDDKFEGNEGEKAFSEGNGNNSDTTAKATVTDNPIENLPGTQKDVKGVTPESTDIE